MHRMRKPVVVSNFEDGGMSDWIPVILLKWSEQRAGQAGHDGVDTRSVDAINAVIHRRNAERICKPMGALPGQSIATGEGAEKEAAQARASLLSLLGEFSIEDENDADGEQLVVTLTRRRNVMDKRQLVSLPERVNFGPFCYQSRSAQVESGGKTMALTPSEAGLLELLLSMAGHVVSRAELLNAVAPRQSDERTVDRAVCRVRRKLSVVGDRYANILRTARGQGYILLAPPRAIDSLMS